MGVITDHVERDAQGRPASERNTGEPEVSDADDFLPARIDPFIQRYLTNRYQMDSEALNQMLTGIIALANLANLMNS